MALLKGDPVDLPAKLTVTATPASAPERKPYTPPQLTVHGSVQTLTALPGSQPGGPGGSQDLAG